MKVNKHDKLAFIISAILFSGILMVIFTINERLKYTDKDEEYKTHYTSQIPGAGNEVIESIKLDYNSLFITETGAYQLDPLSVEISKGKMTEFPSAGVEVFDVPILLLEEDIFVDDELIYEYLPLDEYMTLYTLDWLRVREDPSTKSNIVAKLHPGYKVEVIGETDTGWYAILYNEKMRFIFSEYTSSESPEQYTYNWTWKGPKLNKRDGRIMGPSGSESYYNLPMGRCVEIMNIKGYYGEVWVRSDGCKMFGDYIMVAANLSIRPKGTIVETSLGKGIVVDTGSFINTYPTGIDIATTW